MQHTALGHLKIETENAHHIWTCQTYKAFCTIITIQNTTVLQRPGLSLTGSCYYWKQWQDNGCREITTVFYRFNRALLLHSWNSEEKKSLNKCAVTVPVASIHKILLLVLKIPLPLLQHTSGYHLEHFELARTQPHLWLVISFH